MTAVAQIAAVALAACFAWAAGAKLARPARWRRSLSAYRLSAGTSAVSVAVPALEAGAATLLLLDRRWGSALALVLLCSFSLAVLRARGSRGGRLPCACFGADGERDRRSMLARNGGLGVAAVFVLAAGGGAGALDGIGAAAPADAVPVLLSGAGLALALWTARATMAAFRR